MELHRARRRHHEGASGFASAIQKGTTLIRATVATSTSYDYVSPAARLDVGAAADSSTWRRWDANVSSCYERPRDSPSRARSRTMRSPPSGSSRARGCTGNGWAAIALESVFIDHAVDLGLATEVQNEADFQVSRAEVTEELQCGTRMQVLGCLDLEDELSSTTQCRRFASRAVLLCDKSILRADHLDSPTCCSRANDWPGQIVNGPQR